MPLPLADLSKYPGLQCHPILFAFEGETPRLLTEHAETAKVCLAYYRHVATAAKKAVPEAEYVILNGHETFSAELSPLRSLGREVLRLFSEISEHEGQRIKGL